jgi:hypothetical protein
LPATRNQSRPGLLIRMVGTQNQAGSNPAQSIKASGAGFACPRRLLDPTSLNDRNLSQCGCPSLVV